MDRVTLLPAPNSATTLEFAGAVTPVAVSRLPEPLLLLDVAIGFVASTPVYRRMPPAALAAEPPKLNVKL